MTILTRPDAPAAGPAEAPDAPLPLARQDLAALAADLDARFIKAGSALSFALETSDRIAQAMAGVEAALADGVVADARRADPVDALLAVAARIHAVREEQRGRRETFQRIGAIGKTLSDHVNDIFYTLRLLTIFSMNVKIAALGEAEFVTVVDEMLHRMTAIESEMGGFRRQLDALGEALRRMERAERLLAEETVKAVPAVPDRLAREAAALRTHREGVSTTAHETGVVARSIYARVAAALSAIQIGDIARQRLEHVVTALEMLRDDLPVCAPDAAARAAAERHLLRLLAAQLFDTAADFDRETALLIEALTAIVPDARRLIELQDGGPGDARDTGFLRRLEASVSETESVTRRLRHADEEADTATDVILDLVQSLANRPEMVRRLQRHVQQLAFNIGLRSNGRQGSGGILVASDQIRRVAGELDMVANGIADAIHDLESIASATRGAATAAGTRDDPGAALVASLQAIGAGATRTDEAALAAGGGAARVLGVLSGTCEELRIDLRSGATIRSAGELLDRLAATVAAASEGDASDALHQLLPRVAALYTMASERVIHERFLLPGMASLTEPVAASTGSGADDDLFDDALF